MLITVLILTFLSISTEQVLAANQSQAISKVSTSSKIIALTFDDGSDGDHLQEIIQILTENQVNATFFLTGSAAKAHPDLVKTLLENGNVIGNHSYSHPYFTDLSSTEIKLELEKCEAAIVKITGQSSMPLFRPPYGDYNSSVLQTVHDAGYTEIITWTIDTLDWKGISAGKITKKVLSKATPGSIVLMHAGKGAENTPTALPDIIKGLKDMGYQFVTIPELLDYTPSEGIQSIVKSEDTLLETSKTSGVTDQQIATSNNIENPIENPSKVDVDLILTVPDDKPSPIEYTVKKGDTLSYISRLYGVTVKQLAKANNIANVNLIYPNQILIIPL